MAGPPFFPLGGDYAADAVSRVYRVVYTVICPSVGHLCLLVCRAIASTRHAATLHRTTKRNRLGIPATWTGSVTEFLNLVGPFLAYQLPCACLSFSTGVITFPIHLTAGPANVIVHQARPPLDLSPDASRKAYFGADNHVN